MSATVQRQRGQIEEVWGGVKAALRRRRRRQLAGGALLGGRQWWLVFADVVPVVGGQWCASRLS